PDDVDFEAMREEMEEKRAQMQEQGEFDPSMMRKDFGGGKGGFGEASGGADLNYIDDDPDSYSSIWEGAKTDTTDADHARVIEALKHICAGEDLEQYLDVDNVLRYMAVQTFVVNLDSLTGSMAHNYYLSENDGKLNLLPWDYNLAFGGYMTDDASDMINFPIDTPFTASMEDRQFFAALLENEEYRAQYHTYLRDLCEGYVENEFPQTYAAMRVLLDGLVASEDADPTAFYTNEEYQAAAEMLRQTIELRAESILGQIEGTIPSTSEGQEAEPYKLLDCSSIDLSVMGNMFENGRGDFGGAEPMGDPAQHAAPAAGEFPGQEQPEEGAEAEQTALSAAARPARGADGDGGKPAGGAPPAGTALNAGSAAGETPPAANTDMAADGAPARPTGGPWDSEGESDSDGTEVRPLWFSANLAVTMGALGLLVLAMVFVRLYHRRKFRVK
ncbi:MAG: CotH kinase family protein, partial [Butyricicoccus sp.]